jgi:hypothetical protein
MRTLILPLMFLAACKDPEPGGADDTDPPAGSGTGTLAARFTIDDDWRAAMDEPAAGPFRGSAYLSDEVTAIGPDEGAESVADVFVEAVDLTSGAPTEILWRSEALPVGWVTILGFLDSDGNATPGSEDPDERDPVTLPNENEFEVLEDVETEISIHFGFLNP